uniref:E3 ubiquitin-protein ligase TRIM71-like n=1 Tax=Crassostrea virginica TaxID=6565 RepID=A0A8B8CXU6_CRAVI|nr:E3 ubiquitin-protein ligase TRIM71-like [Crassostrea virginica]
MMASQMISQGQEAVECGLCQNPVSFFCRRCGVNLCDSCLPDHVRAKHDVVDYASKDDDDVCFCDSHPENKCSAYCKKCDVPICILCVSIKHRSHEISELQDKVEELLKDISGENDRLQSFRHEMETLLDHTTKQLSSLSSFYQQKKDEVTARGKEWHKLIDNHVKKLHQELDELQKQSESAIQKQKREFEEMIGKMDEMNRKTTVLQKSKNVTEMQKFRLVIKGQKTLREFTQYTFPTFLECKIDENYMKTYFGYIEKMQERKIPLLEKNVMPDPDSGRRVLEAPSVSSVIDTGFPADKKYNKRLYDMAVTDDQKVWMGGQGTELKLFDLQGHLHHTVTITSRGLYICMYNKQVLYTDRIDNTVKKISDDDTVVTLFTTGDWSPRGITGSASGDLLVCLFKDDQSKVVRYSSNGTVLQEIQYDSQCQPLYQKVWYIAENVNGDIIVTDYKKGIVIAVDRLGIFRYTYSKKDKEFYALSVATDSVGHVYVTDGEGDKIHMLDRDGRFLRYIIPEGGIEAPRAVCMVGDREMIVGECLTGLAKRINFLEEKT